MQIKRIILDNGHGINTPGKRSVDGRLREYLFNRQIVELVEQRLIAAKIPYDILVPELIDVSLAERCRRANAIAQRYGASSTLLISCHANAAGMGEQWQTAKGVCVFHDNGTSQLTVKRAGIFLKEIIKETGLTQHNSGVLPDNIYGSGYMILSKTRCPAVLLETGFMTNKEECEWLLKTENQNKIADGITAAILKIVSTGVIA